MRILSILLLYILTQPLKAQQNRVDSIYNTMSEEERFAQFFVVMDSCQVDTSKIKSTPVPFIFVSSGGNIGNLRNANLQKERYTVINKLENGKITGVNTQIIGSDEMISAALEAGDNRNYLHFLINKSKTAGSPSFLFNYTSPWVKTFDFLAISKFTSTDISFTSNPPMGIIYNTANGVKVIDVFYFPSSLIDNLTQVPVNANNASTINHSNKEEIELAVHVIKNGGLFYSINYQNDIKLIKELISNNLITQKQIKESVEKIIKLRLEHLTKEQEPQAKKERLEEIYQARTTITLLVNELNLLPLNRIDSLSLTSVCFTKEQSAKVISTIKKYTPHCSEIVLNENDTSLTKHIEHINLITNSIIIDLTDEAKATKFLPQIQFLTKNKTTILIVHEGNSRIAYWKELLKAHAVIRCYKNDDINTILAIESIFGGAAFRGKSPEDIEGICSKGQGIITQATRLGTALPEEVGMNSETLTTIDNIVELGIKAKAMPGCQVLVAKDGKIIFQKSYGKLSFYEPIEEVTDTTLYDMASVTKIVSSMPLLMKLYEADALNIDTTLQTYLPRLKGTNKGSLTLKEILAHQSGLVPFIPFYQNTFDKTLTEGPIYSNRYSDKYSIKIDERLFFNRYTVSRQDIVANTKTDQYSVEIARDLYMNKSYIDSMYLQLDTSAVKTRGKYVYSDCGYYYYKQILENYYHQRLDTLIADNFYNPMGLIRTGYNPLNRYHIQSIAPTEQDLMFRKQTVRGYVHDPGAAMMGGVAGHAGVFSTATDMAAMMQMYLNGGTYAGKRFLQESTISKFTAQVYPNSRRGLGFDKPEPNKKKINPVSDYCSPQSFGHTGFTGTMVWADPTYNLVYIFLSNRIHPNAYNKKLIKMDIRQKIQDVIYQSITDNR